MSERVERKTITVEECFWKQPELADFVMDVFGLFMAKFGPKEIGYQKYLYHNFNLDLKSLTLEKEENAQVSLPNGLTFAFCDYPEQVYQDEFDDLVNMDNKKLQIPLENEIFFWVELERSSGNKQTFKRIIDFFHRLKDDGYPITEISTGKKVQGRNYCGEVHARIKPDEFRGEVRLVPIEALSPRVRVLEKRRLMWQR